MGSKPMREPSGTPGKAPGTSGTSPCPMPTVRTGVPTHTGAAAGPLPPQMGPQLRVIAPALRVVTEDGVRRCNELELLFVGLDIHGLARTSTARSQQQRPDSHNSHKPQAQVRE